MVLLFCLGNERSKFQKRGDGPKRFGNFASLIPETASSTRLTTFQDYRSLIPETASSTHLTYISGVPELIIYHQSYFSVALCYSKIGC
jgi:hypothetical protein